MFANCGGNGLEDDAHAGDAGLGNHSGASVGATGGSGGTENAAGEAGTAGSQAGLDSLGGSSGGEEANGGGGDSTAGGRSGEGGRNQTGGAAGAGDDGGTGGQSEPTRCGDGNLDIGEDCDDGTLTSGDGCSDACEVEVGFTCSSTTCDTADGRCQRQLPITFRDFNSHTMTGGHPDFEPGFNSPGAIMGLIRPELDEDGKPVLVAASTAAFLNGAEAFSQWYRDTPAFNATIERELVLWNDGDGIYANRWGKNGERWPAGSPYKNIQHGGEAGMGCTECTLSATGACYDPCIPLDEAYPYSCCAEPGPPDFDGAPLFFPVDDYPLPLNDSPARARVPEQFGWYGYPLEAEVAAKLGRIQPRETAWAPFPSDSHNFNFTSELKFGLRHDAETSTTISVEGDDDIWVFLNGRLAIDLGSWHVPVPGSVTIAGNVVTTSAQLDVMIPPTVVTGTQSAGDFGLVNGEVFQVAIFHAERQKEGATFRLTVSGQNWNGSVCVPK